MLARIVSVDPRSSTFTNLRYLERLTGLSRPQFYSAARVQAALPVKVVPEKETWRIGLLDSLFKLRVEDSKRISSMINSLCST